MGATAMQKRDVVVYRLISCGTVEEKIYRKQVRVFPLLQAVWVRIALTWLRAILYLHCCCGCKS